MKFILAVSALFLRKVKHKDSVGWFSSSFALKFKIQV
jgi:hypothetical protein